MPRLKTPIVQDAQVVFKLPSGLREKLEALAVINERTLSQELRRAVRRHIAAEKEAGEVRAPTPSLT